jgi:hypothetical protein
MRVHLVIVMPLAIATWIERSECGDEQIGTTRICRPRANVVVPIVVGEVTGAEMLTLRGALRHAGHRNASRHDVGSCALAKNSKT